MILCYNIFIILLVNTFSVMCVNPGPKFKPTKGEVWPKPQNQVRNDTYYIMESENLNITIPYYTCDILEAGIKRLLRRNYAHKQYLTKVNEKQKKHNNDDSKLTFILSEIEFRIELTKQCEDYPHLDMDEKYLLTVGKTIVLSSASIWGILRGMETFNQLIYFSDDYTELRINATIIEDYPSYKYRGLLIDTGRHYLKTETITLLIDAMEINKMNVLHWHIVDDQSFPYQSMIYPNLSKNGAFHSSMVYTKKNIQQIIERGRLAGIRVIPEFDVPGHVRSWGEAYPQILTKCYHNKEVVGLGPLDPINNATYMFLKSLYKEVTQLFPDEYIHFGGDEINTKCWQSDPKIQDYMVKNGIKNINALQTLFMNKVQTVLPPKTKYMLWQDVFDLGVNLPNKTILQVWRYGWVKEMDKILKAGHRVVFSSSWYLDYINQDWDTFLRADPRHMVFIERKSAEGLEDIIGGEACMWGERVDDTNIISRVWPRTSAVAERLWTGMNYTQVLPINPVTDYARRRIEEHVCRMRQNGISAEPPNGPGFCFGVDSTIRRHKSRRYPGK